jgi:hypothetical protein
MTLAETLLARGFSWDYKSTRIHTKSPAMRHAGVFLEFGAIQHDRREIYRLQAENTAACVSARLLADPGDPAMTTSEVKRQVPIVARAFAAERYRKDHPRAGDDAAVIFAQRSWAGFVDMALDFLALRIALAEQEAAPWN